MGKAELARKLCDSSKFDEALRFFKELESDSSDPSEIAGYLLDEATCYTNIGNTSEANKCISKARTLIGGDPLALAQIDYLTASLLIEDGRREEGLQALADIVSRNPPWLKSKQGRELYEKIQIQRGFTLMHLCKSTDAHPLLEEASSFQLEDDVRSSVHCHLGRCYHELGRYSLAKKQFVAAQRLGIPEEWEGTFHYYYGYTLYQLKEFDAAKRELILSLQTGSNGPPAPYKYKLLAAIYRKLADHAQARRYDDMAEPKAQ